MEGSFNPEKIPHVKGQDRRIESREKAWVMASTQETFESTAKALTDEKREQEPALQELRDLGITPEYVRVVGDLVAESVGAMYDYQEEVADKSINELMKDVEDCKYELLKHNNHPLVSAEEIRTPDNEEALSVNAKRFDLRLPDTDIVEQQRVTRLVNKFATANKELGRRGQYVKKEANE